MSAQKLKIRKIFHKIFFKKLKKLKNFPISLLQKNNSDHPGWSPFADFSRNLSHRPMAYGLRPTAVGLRQRRVRRH
jgi:hypothetical protein